MKITLSGILGFIFSIMFLLSGMVLLFDSNTIIFGFCLIAIGLLFFPPLLQFLKKEQNLELSRGLRFVIAGVLFFVGADNLYDSKNFSSIDKQSTAKTESVAKPEEPSDVEIEEQKGETKTCVAPNYYLLEQLGKKYPNLVLEKGIENKKTNEKTCSVEFQAVAYDLEKYELVKLNLATSEDENKNFKVDKFSSEKLDSSNKAYSFDADKSNEQLVYISANKANLRAKPKNGKVIETLEEEVSAHIISKDPKNKDWYLIALQDITNKGKIGWISRKLLITKAGYKRKIELEFFGKNYDLIIDNWSFSKSYSNFIVEGQVTNNSPLSLNYLKAVFTGKDKNGNFVTSDSSYVEYRPLLPKQKTPFKIYVDYNPAVVTGFVDFSIDGIKLKSTSKKAIKKMKKSFKPDDYRP